MHLPAQTSPELNTIEWYWGYVKHFLRLYCKCSLAHMLKILPGVIGGVTLGYIRAWSRVTWLYIEAYDEGLANFEIEKKNRHLKRFTSYRAALGRGDACQGSRKKCRGEEEGRQEQ